MKLRTATVFVCVFDAALWLLIALATFISGSDAATRGLDQAAGWIVTALFVVTTGSAVALVVSGRAGTTALMLALAFPVVLTAAVGVAIVAFA